MGKSKEYGSIGFIGGGRITRILLDGWKKEDDLPGAILVSDSNPDVLKALQAGHPGIEISAANSKAAGCDVVFLALHPPAIGGILEDIQSSLKPDAILISLAPKWTIAKLSAALGGFNRIVRMIPNAPSVIGKGYNPLAFSPAITADLKKEILHLFKSLGDCPEVEEEKLEAYAILSAMGPTYFWFQMQKLRELGVSFGLTGKETDKVLYEMIKGAAKTIFKSGLSYSDVANLIPVKPLAEDEAAIIQAYEIKLKGLYEKLKS
ncbi:MAG: NAD(P)-binding domain-containing protein [Deltaproteobacteria bacterium]